LRFEVKLVDVFRFEGVKIASQHEYFDRLSVLGQLGWLDADFVEPVMN
jgi:hypothetical protein